ncbi:unnamed protein product [Pleuronectes platessa]|uniref:Uncharacterized protein n=1 Tax=Pleuronectes platessa TaxID=8262 RepID=A0A9N7VMV3_PLEPL|nr:unnamed protein product [Pleuronectes platessa]
MNSRLKAGVPSPLLPESPALSSSAVPVWVTAPSTIKPHQLPGSASPAAVFCPTPPTTQPSSSQIDHKTALKLPHSRLPSPQLISCVGFPWSAPVSQSAARRRAEAHRRVPVRTEGSPSVAVAEVIREKGPTRVQSGRPA